MSHAVSCALSFHADSVALRTWSIVDSKVVLSLRILKDHVSSECFLSVGEKSSPSTLICTYKHTASERSIVKNITVQCSVGQTSLNVQKTGCTLSCEDMVDNSGLNLLLCFCPLWTDTHHEKRVHFELLCWSCVHISLPVSDHGVKRVWCLGT